ncbi:hypothetical protein [Rhodocaloribacter sp.]
MLAPGKPTITVPTLIRAFSAFSFLPGMKKVPGAEKSFVPSSQAHDETIHPHQPSAWLP